MADKNTKIEHLIPKLADNAVAQGIRDDNEPARRLFSLNDWLKASGFDAPVTHICPWFSGIYNVDGNEVACVVVKGVIYVFENGQFLGGIKKDEDIFHDLEKAIKPANIRFSLLSAS